MNWVTSCSKVDCRDVCWEIKFKIFANNSVDSFLCTIKEKLEEVNEVHTIFE